MKEAITPDHATREKDYLAATFGLQCWGCNLLAPDERHLHLNHVNPTTEGGGFNHLDNQALLCRPCNPAKSNKLTLDDIRRENIPQEHLTKSPGTKQGEGGHTIKPLHDAQAQHREALERPAPAVGEKRINRKGER